VDTARRVSPRAAVAFAETPPSADFATLTRFPFATRGATTRACFSEALIVLYLLAMNEF
jgi:hypothetical protein